MLGDRLGDKDTLGEIEGLTEGDRLGDKEGLRLGLIEGDRLTDGLTD
jgi:hypothetical protein